MNMMGKLEMMYLFNSNKNYNATTRTIIMRLSFVLFFARGFAFSIGKFPSHFTLSSNMAKLNSTEESFEDLFEESFGTILPPLTEKLMAKIDLNKSKTYITQTSIKENVAPMPGFLIADELSNNKNDATGMKSGVENVLHKSCEERLMERELHLCGYDGIGLADCVTAIAKQLGQECSTLSDSNDTLETFLEYSCAISNSNDWVQWRSWTVYSLKYRLALNCGIADSNNGIDSEKITSTCQNLKYECQNDLSKLRIRLAVIY